MDLIVPKGNGISGIGVRRDRDEVSIIRVQYFYRPTQIFVDDLIIEQPEGPLTPRKPSDPDKFRATNEDIIVRVLGFWKHGQVDTYSMIELPPVHTMTSATVFYSTAPGEPANTMVILTYDHALNQPYVPAWAGLERFK